MSPSPAPLRAAALIGAAAIALIGATPAAAEEGGEARGWTLTIGGGAQVYPKYPGGDSLGVSPMPIIGLRRQGAPLPFEAPDEGWGFGLLGDDSPINFGPAIQFQNRRQEEDVGAPVGDVGFTVEAGAFVEVFPVRNFRLRAEGRQGLGGHRGMIGDLGADFVVRDRDTYVFSIGPRARFSDDDYQDAYFAVTPAVAAATGLPAYDPDGGLHAVGVVAGLTYMLNRNWGVTAYAGYDRLVRDAADSPIVREFGSRNQWSAGLGISYSFDVGSLFGS
ncbi:MAG TPA: MipA/OmpV family protein [Allosphingosinicella sp.]|nr:MipA/OmpV family protein [Allosphingosinicella sp.]